MPIRQVPRLIAQLYQTVGELNSLFPRPFTPDGHLVGSIGEVVASYLYGVDLAAPSNPGFDGCMKDGRTVEIKLTGGDAVDITESATLGYPKVLIVLKLQKQVGFEEVYAGDFPAEFLKEKSKGNRFVRISLKHLMQRNPKQLEHNGRLEELNSLFQSIA